MNQLEDTTPSSLDNYYYADSESLGEYSAEHVAALLGQLRETLTQPDAWARMSLDEVVAVAETLVRLDVKDVSLLAAIDALIAKNCASIDAKNFSKLLNSYAHLGFLDGWLIGQLRSLALIASMDPCHLSGVMFAVGKLKLAASPGRSMGLTAAELSQAVQRLCTRAAEVVDRFSPLEMSTVIFALARLNVRSMKLLNLFAESLVLKLPDSSPQIVSNTVYAMGKLGFKSAQLLDTVAEMCPPRLAQFKPQELANLVYAFGQLDYRNDAFLLALADHVPSRLPTFKPQELSITAYAYSQLRVSHPRMFSGIAIQIARRIDECSPQAISNTVYAMSKVGFRHNGLLTAMALSLPRRLHELTPQHVSNIMYSFGKLNHRDDTLLAAFCAHVPGRLWEFRPQNIANTVYATGKLNYYHEELLDAVATHLPLRLTECVSQDISNIVYSFGQLGYRNEAFSVAISNYVSSVLVPRGMQQKDMSYLVSAFRKAGIPFDDPSEDFAYPGVPPVGQRMMAPTGLQVNLSRAFSSSTTGPQVNLSRELSGICGAAEGHETPQTSTGASEPELMANLIELDRAARACNVDLLSCLMRTDID